MAVEKDLGCTEIAVIFAWHESYETSLIGIEVDSCSLRAQDYQSTAGYSQLGVVLDFSGMSARQCQTCCLAKRHVYNRIAAEEQKIFVKKVSSNFETGH